MAGTAGGVPMPFFVRIKPTKGAVSPTVKQLKEELANILPQPAYSEACS